VGSGEVWEFYLLPLSILINDCGFGTVTPLIDRVATHLDEPHGCIELALEAQHILLKALSIDQASEICMQALGIMNSRS
jgi:hypothetical protein